MMLTGIQGGQFAAGNFRHGIFRSGFISHAVLNLLWEVLAPILMSCWLLFVLLFYWARDFKQRYNMTWRSSDANRAPATFVHIVADNAWRRQTQFSTPLLAVGYGRD